MKLSWLLATTLLTVSACASTPSKPVTTLAKVDIERFMGDWYVIAHIPTFIEKEAYNAIESYRRDPDGSIATTFTFNKGSFTGPQKRYNPRGFVLDDSNAHWGMRFVWPFKADYRISYLSADYSVTVIGRQQRDYVWIMARTPQIDAATYQQLVRFIQDEGYDISQLRRVPQQVPPARAALNPVSAELRM